MIMPLAYACPPLDNGHAQPNAFFIFISMKKNTSSSYTETPIRVAILIDGGYFIKRYNAMYNKSGKKTAITIANDLYTISHSHVGKNNYLYRIFYYDCIPFNKKAHNPISKKCIDFSKTDEAIRRNELINEMRKKRKVALRLGTIKESKRWVLYDNTMRKLLKKEISFDELEESDVYYELRQKGIDMKIGVDIATLALKGFVDKIVLISGDSDFVPAAKLARREGIDFVLDPMHCEHIENNLYEHIDGLKSIPLYYQKDTKSKVKKD